MKKIVISCFIIGLVFQANSQTIELPETLISIIFLSSSIILIAFNTQIAYASSNILSSISSSAWKRLLDQSAFFRFRTMPTLSQTLRSVS